jgi:hypothetical protein
MSIGPMSGILVSAAGVPLAQSKGADVDRAEQDVNVQKRDNSFEQKAEAAAGIGETDGEDNKPSERDADGRLPWKRSPHPQNANDDDKESVLTSHKVTDPTGESGNLLDLSG